MDAFNSSYFIDDAIEVEFDLPPAREKTPTCPQRFTWRGDIYQVNEALAEWSDFSRRGRSARNMRPSHSTVAAGRGSLGVGRFFFRVSTGVGRIFEIYYDRAPKDAQNRKGAWFLYRELKAE
ncbi:MAG TPA: DUF6504 family protein [Anaerolineales bacterium]|jgi:hypothetical protein